MNVTKLTAIALLLAAGAASGQVSPAINPRPSRTFGHARLTLGTQTTAPNLLEGKELNGPTAIAFDTSSSPAIVYVADTFNNRVLAWRNPAALTAGNPADKVIGQRDFLSSLQGGPGTTTGGLTSAGLALPNGLAVDSSGNLYVLDAGNNRIVRFPRPLEQQGEFVSPDLVIGQKTVATGNQPNQGQAQPGSRTLAFNRFGTVLRAGLTFDAQGNLWVTDPYNNRVLRYPRAALNANEPAADLVLGQSSFETDTAATQQNDLVNLSRPASVAVDERGGVYVTDQLARVLYYDAPAIGVSARRILGIPPAQQVGQPPRPPAPNDYTVGLIVQDGQLRGGVPQCVVTLGVSAFVCDNVAHRIVRYGPPESWPAATTEAPSPQIQNVYGQDTLFTGVANRGRGASRPQSNTLNTPAAMAFFNNELWVVDTGNNRVIAIPRGAGNFEFFGGASRLLGQIAFDANAPNLIDGRELFVYSSAFRGTAVAVDRSSTPNRLYVADSQNHRILGFRDVRTVGTDARNLLTRPADIVIGQADLFHAVVNYPTGDPLTPTDQGLSLPSGVAVDGEGNLWVADTGNGRLLRFPRPFEQPPGTVHRANLVLGQPNFTIKITDASSTTMAAPVGVVVFNNGDLAASDLVHNRVLLFRKLGADFANGQPARAVLGQPSFTTTGAGSSTASLNGPRNLAVDTGDRLYVADAGNNRVLVFSSTATINNGASGAAIPGISGPEGVAVSRATGEIWISSLNTNQVLRFREFTQVVGDPNPTAAVASNGPLALALDEFDNLIVVEAANRVTFYYARLVYRHAATSASGSNQIATMTPNLYAYVARLGKDFELTPAQGTVPYPKELSGIQVLVEGIPAPITSITNNLIYFLVPNDAPTSGEAEFLITRPATGEILAAGTFLMGRAAPGFFTANQQGTRQVIATHFPDGSLNSSGNPIGQDQILTLWLTGYGRLENAPPDGVAPGAAIPINKPLRVIIGGVILSPDKILYSGLNPALPGLWQINIRMPKNGDPGGAPLPGNAVPIVVQLDDVASNIGGTAQLGVDQQLTVTNGLITTLALR
jgi:uncharacterized protein (TIGR03437 family)